jgi:hypothetical protein
MFEIWDKFNPFIQSNRPYIYLILICYVVMFETVILNLFVQTCDDIFVIKVFFVFFPEDGPRSPKHVGEIIMTKHILMHEYLQSFGINTV